MKIFLIAFMILIIITPTVQAKYNLKVGTNFSKIQENGSEPKTGITFGIGKNWSLFGNFKIGTDLLFTTRGGILKDKSFSLNPSISQDVYTLDIHVCVGYLELPLMVKYSIFNRRNINIMLNLGPSIAIPVLDFSKTANGKHLFFFIPDDPENIVNNVEYGWNIDSEFYSEKVYFDVQYNLCTEIQLSNFSFELRYSHGNRDIGPVELITPIHKKLNSFHFIVAYSL